MRLLFARATSSPCSVGLLPGGIFQNYARTVSFFGQPNRPSGNTLSGGFVVRRSRGTNPASSAKTP